ARASFHGGAGDTDAPGRAHRNFHYFCSGLRKLAVGAKSIGDFLINVPATFEHSGLLDSRAKRANIPDSVWRAAAHRDSKEKREMKAFYLRCGLAILLMTGCAFHVLAQES